MIKGKQIKAILMLLMMLGMMAHNAFPHIHHHQHELDDITLSSDDSHHHDSDHGHKHGESDEPREYEYTNLFDFLIKGHSHSLHSNQLILVDTEEYKKPETHINSHFLLVSLCQIRVGNGHDGSVRYTFSDQIQYSNPCLCSNLLRGPPVLG